MFREFLTLFISPLVYLINLFFDFTASKLYNYKKFLGFTLNLAIWHNFECVILTVKYSRDISVLLVVASFLLWGKNEKLHQFLLEKLFVRFWYSFRKVTRFPKNWSKISDNFWTEIWKTYIFKSVSLKKVGNRAFPTQEYALRWKLKNFLNGFPLKNLKSHFREDLYRGKVTDPNYEKFF